MRGVRSGRQKNNFIVSTALRNKLKKSSYERRGFYTRKWKQFESVSNKRTQASDHMGVVAEFGI